MRPRDGGQVGETGPLGQKDSKTRDLQGERGKRTAKDSLFCALKCLKSIEGNPILLRPCVSRHVKA